MPEPIPLPLSDRQLDALSDDEFDDYVLTYAGDCIIAILEDLNPVERRRVLARVLIRVSP